MNGDFTLHNLIGGEREVVALINRVNKTDPQAAELLINTLDAISGELEIPEGHWQAVNRLRMLVASPRHPMGTRNAIFKAANLTGLKLPSANF